MTDDSDMKKYRKYRVVQLNDSRTEVPVCSTYTYKPP